MIGKLTVAGVVATLDDDGVWRSDDDGLAAALNTQFPGDTATPDQGRMGVAAVHQAADTLGGTAEISGDDADAEETETH